MKDSSRKRTLFVNGNPISAVVFTITDKLHEPWQAYFSISAYLQYKGILRWSNNYNVTTSDVDENGIPGLRSRPPFYKAISRPRCCPPTDTGALGSFAYDVRYNLQRSCCLSRPYIKHALNGPLRSSQRFHTILSRVYTHLRPGFERQQHRQSVHEPLRKRLWILRNPYSYRARARQSYPPHGPQIHWGRRRNLVASRNDPRLDLREKIENAVKETEQCLRPECVNSRDKGRWDACSRLAEGFRR